MIRPVHLRWQSAVSTLCLGAIAGALSAQQIDIGLYPTAVPDSFEVRVISHDVTYAESLVSLVFTLRWESSAGGALNGSDLHVGCSGLQFFNVGGIVVDGDHAYATFDILNLHPLDEDCQITPTGTSLGGIRIRQLSGCHHVRIVNDVHTDQANGNYFISVGGLDRTGAILTGSLASDTCPPCDIPQITSITGDLVIQSCSGQPVDLFVAATGSPEFQWYDPQSLGIGFMAGYGQTLHDASGSPGTYIAVALNDCGSDTATVNVVLDGCVPPQILGIAHTGMGCGNDPLILTPTVEGSCPQYMWTGSGLATGTAAIGTVYGITPGSYTYHLLVTTPCGSDTLTTTIDVGSCLPPQILELTYHQECTGMLLCASVENGTCAEYTWTGPVPVPGGYDNVLVPNAPSGTYQVVVSNACGSDSLSLQVDVGTGCVAPEILEITYALTACSHLQLHATVEEGGCAEYTWTGPVPVPDGSASVLVPDASTGTYELWVTNPCGSDSLSVQVDVDSAECVAPEILGITSSPTGIGCYSTITLLATMNWGLECVQYTWSGPQDVLDGSTLATVPNALQGIYELVATNACGSDSLSITVVNDTLGAVMAVITEITNNSPICEGETLVLNAVVNDPGATFQWTSWSYTAPPFDVPDGSPTVIIPNAPDAFMYYLSMTNACGTTSSMQEPHVIAADASDVHICTESPQPVDLNNSLHFHVSGGTWTFNGAPHVALFDPQTDGPGIYYYQDPSALGCPDVPVTVDFLPLQNSGTNGSVTLCSTDDPVDLFLFLGGSPDLPGSWTYAMGDYASAIYDPATCYPGTYRYHAYCSPSQPALVFVTELDPTTWYADGDGDGFGDPNVSLLDCEPSGYVSDNTDGCPQVFGTIGSSCDDGLSSTINDALDGNCTCVGELPTGLDPAAQAATTFAVGPNPNSGGPWTVVTGDLGQVFSTVTFELLDVLGNRVFTRMLNVNGRSVQAIVDPGTPPAAGLYMARLQAGRQVFVQRVVVK